MEREINAVDSEYKNTLSNPEWKLYYLYKFFSRKEHRFSKFNVGNKETLDKEYTYENLMDFYQK